MMVNNSNLQLNRHLMDTFVAVKTLHTKYK